MQGVESMAPPLPGNRSPRSSPPPLLLENSGAVILCYMVCTQERLTILKMLRDKRVTVMNKNSEIYGSCRHKTCFHQFCLSTDDPVLNG